MIKAGKNFIIIGIFLTVIAFILVGFNIRKFIDDIKATSTYEEKVFEYEYNNNIKKIEIVTKNVKITIKESKSNTIKIEYFENRDAKFEVYTKNNTLYFKEKTIFRFINFDLASLFENTNITVYIPNESYEELSINNTNGGITFENIKKLEFENIDLSTSNGRIELNEVIADDISIKTSNGRIDISEVTSKKIYAKSSNGSLNLYDTISKDIELKTSNGSINAKIIGNKNDYNFELKTSNGKIKLNNNEYSNKLNENNKSNQDIYAKTSNGSIKINFFE